MENQKKNIRGWVLGKFFILAVIFANIGCDQATKSIVRKKINYYEQIPIAGDIAYLTKVENQGGMLSMGHSLPDFLRNILLTHIPTLVIIVGFILLLVFKGNLSVALLGYGFVIGGGIGNLIDRHIHGSVTDFMNIGIGNIRTGIFNMADVSIMVGLGLLLFKPKLVKRSPAPTAQGKC